MPTLNHLVQPEQRAAWLRAFRVRKARTPDIAALFASSAAVLDVEIEGPPAQPEIMNGRPVRRFLRRTVVYTTGYFTSLKNDEVMAWESPNEKNALSLLECDPDVTKFATQPITISYPWLNSDSEYTPDILVWRGRQPAVVEIKGFFDAEDPSIRLKRRLFEAYFDQFDIPYLVWDRSILEAEPRLSNAQLLLRARDRVPSSQEKLRVLAHLGRVERASVAELASTSEASDGERVVHALLLRGVLAANLNEPLCRTTLVHRYVGASK